MRTLVLALLLCAGLPHLVWAQPSDDFDQYRLRIDAAWLYNYPSGSVKAQGDTLPLDFSQDLHFPSFSTFTGKVDWKFTRKNHLYVEFTPASIAQDIVAQRSFVFRGQTINVGASARAELTSNIVAPGYQYDIIRRKRGHLGLGLQLDLINVTATVSAQAQIVGANVRQASVSASDSILAPIPVAGPEFRLYLTPRVYVDGNVRGMYFFGYGSFVSNAEGIGVVLTPHVALTGGYQVASRLIVNDRLDRLGLRMTHQGATVGLSVSF
jgi:hypothetical protein